MVHNRQDILIGTSLCTRMWYLVIYKMLSSIIYRSIVSHYNYYRTDVTEFICCSLRFSFAVFNIIIFKSPRN